MQDDSLVDRLAQHAALRPDTVAIRFIEGDADPVPHTYAALDRRIRAVAAELQRGPTRGERAILLFPAGIDYAVAFYACLYAGIIAVPAYPPERARAQHAERLQGILRDASPSVVLTDSRLRPMVEEQLALGNGGGIRIVEVDRVPLAQASDWRRPATSPSDIAFLQYTSGSTSQPKGVLVSHGNLVANQRAISGGFGTRPDDVVMSWLPLYHDMGLIGGLLQPLYTGISLVLMPTRSFLEQPRRWLQAVSRHRATVSGGPDFAYRLCADRISDAVIQELDLGHWRVAFSGSELIRAETLDRFADRFGAAGFTARSFYPCYGLAEATLFVTSRRGEDEPRIAGFVASELAERNAVPDEAGTRLVSCGAVQPEHAVRIMRETGDGETAAGTVGEIWVRGPSVALGYWNNQAASAAAFVARGDETWLRTGDLGFLHDGGLFIAGRLKDMLIIRGQNLYPQDVEQAVEAEVEFVRSGRVAVFPVEVDGREAVGIAAEIGRSMRKLVPAQSLAQAVGQAVVQVCGEFPAVVVLLNPHGLPLTTSGKIQRAACRALWAKGELDSFAILEQGVLRDAAASVATTAPASETEAALGAIWSELFGGTASEREADFFALGGNSITVAQLAAAVRERFGLDLEIQALFQHPTLAALAAHIAGLRAGGSTSGLPATLPLADRAAPLPLSHAQERLWFLWQLDPASAAYNLACSISFAGSLDRPALIDALAALVQRHEILRTRFRAVEGTAFQVIEPAAAPTIGFDDLGGLADQERTERLAALGRADLQAPFDLTVAAPLRLRLVRLGDQDHVLQVTIHHIAGDARSMEVMLADLAALYAGTAPTPLPVQYADYARWQRAWLAAGEGERQLAYWRTRLADEDEDAVLALPFDRPRPAVQSPAAGHVDFALDAAAADRLRALARRHRATPFMALLAAYQALLHRYAGQDSIRVGVPTANRRHAQLDGLIGFFVNTLVLDADLSGRPSFAELLARTRDVTLQALAHQDLPFERLVDGLRPDRSLGHNPLFQAKFNYIPAPLASDWTGGLRAETRIAEPAGTHFDLALDILDDGRGMVATLTYAADLFDQGTIAAMAAQFRAILDQVSRDETRPLADLELAPEAQALPVAERAAFPAAGFLDLFAAQVRSRPDAPAVTDGDRTVPYGALDAWSNRIARLLAGRGIALGAPVAVRLERSPAFVAALLGVLKAGGAYVPLDPAWPNARIAALLADCGARILLDQENVDAESVGDPAVEPTAPDIHPDQPAYIIYTSGSTGAPKGVVVGHGALANYVQALLRRLDPLPAAPMAMVSTVAADLGHTVLFGALAGGALLHLVPQDCVTDADRFADYMSTHGIGTLKIVPSHLRGLLQAGRGVDLLPRDLLVLGGEATDSGLVAEIRALRPDCRIVNHYGPTETSVGVLTHEILDASDPLVPVGRPLANMRAHLLDASLNPVPAGAAGELFIGGPGLARGYLGRPGLTAERFVPDPFGPPGERLYRTGDLARLDRDGRLHFLGRADDQVKIRGYRVEPGEVARVLRGLEGVRDAAVLARDGRLIGYCVAAAGTAPEALRPALAAILPDHMVPARILLLDRLPLTANGKLDRAALPADEAPAAASTAAPEGEIEQAIAEVWHEVLGVAVIGRTDNFFELGGDSILSLQIIARLRKRGIRLTPKQIFDAQTVVKLAGLATLASPPAKAPPPKPASCPVPLLPIQQRFFATPMPERHHWNQAMLLVPSERLDWGRLGTALAALVDHHDALRLRFGAGGTAEPGAAPADLLWIRETADVTAVSETAQRSLSVDGQLVRAVGMDLPDGGQRLLVVIHHLVVDGVSWRVLLEDLQAAYAGAPLPAKTSSLREWSERLRGLDVAGELPFWQAQAAGDLPSDHQPDGPETIADGAEIALSFDAHLTARLLRDAPAAYRTQVNDLLLAALARAVESWSGHRDLLVELEGHGREDVFAEIDLSRTVGWFTTAFPVRLESADDLAGTVKAVKEQLRAVPHRGLGYGLLALPDAQPRITFNYLGQFDGSFGALFAPAPDSPGASRGPSAPLGRWLTVNGFIRDGRLQFSWTYGTRRYERATIERLVLAYDQAVRDIVAHCTSGASGLTPSDVALSGLDQAGLDRLALPAEAEDLYPLSPMQQGLLFHALQDGGDIYVSQVSVAVQGLDPQRLRRSWQKVADRHPTLRTGFLWRDLAGVPQQFVLRQVTVPFTIEEEGDIAAIAAAERAAGFDLARPPLQRVRLVRTGADSHQLIWTHHHLVMDGWSSARLIGEVMADYRDGNLPPTAGRYRDYIAWLAEAKTSEPFWREQLAALDAPTLLADALVAGPRGTGHGTIALPFDATATARLQAFARAERITLNSLVQGAWVLLLQRYAGRRTVVFGATVSGRPAHLSGAEEMLGLFINTLPVVEGPGPEARTGAWLRDLQGRNAVLREHEHTPLNEIQRWAGCPGQPLFDSILVFENYPVDQALRAGDGPVFGTVAHSATTNYALTVTAFTGGDRLELELTYDRARFDDAVMARLRDHLATLLTALAADPQAQLGTLSLVSDVEAPALTRPVETSPVELVVAGIERQAAARPDAVAVLGALSYGALNRRANQLARHLRSLGIGPDVAVGLSLARRPELIVAMLAVLKAGGCYVPLDPDYPAERLAYMVADSGLVLTIDQAWLDGLDLSGLDGGDLPAQAGPETLAYLIYTSGSTGQPKGVAVAHGALAMHCRAIVALYDMGPRDRELQFASINFDIAHERWLTPLLAGGAIGLASAKDLSIEGLVAQVRHQAISLLFLPPAFANQLSDTLLRSGESLDLRLLIVGGEAWSKEGVEAARAAFGGARLVNAYGPTETVIAPLAWPVEASGLRDGAYAPIGRPVGERSAVVLDGDLNLAPTGVTGELFIGGGLARGYHGRPGLTAERFVPNPFGAGRLYRTGDRVRRRPDGIVEYVGRADQQVKIRGFRIEPGEIEARLLAHPDVSAAVVIARAGRLIGYAVGGTPEDLKAHLAASLPDHMVPAQIVALDQLPLTPNGKVERKALPDPEWRAAEHVAPRTETEQALAAIWAALLGFDSVGVTDNFFELGGDSLLALRAVTTIRQELDRAVAPRDLFDHPTIERLARHLEAAGAATLDAGHAGEIDALLARFEAAE